MKTLTKILLALAAAACLSSALSAPADAQNLSGTYLYAQRDTCDLFFDVYEPTEGSEITFEGKPKPTLLFVYGGGFVGGFRSNERYHPWFKILNDNGYKIITIDYRLGLKGVPMKFTLIGKIKTAKNTVKAVEMGVEDLFSAVNYIIANAETLEVTYGGKNIADVLDMTVSEACEFFAKVPSLARKLKTLDDVGLGYIALGQSATTLSGGEAQRIKLATELSRRATGRTMYLLDEPTTGLHFDDVAKLMRLLMRLRDQGNTIVVIEHNVDVMRCADWIIDLGPGGGDAGGNLVCQGTVADVRACKESVTGRFL